MIFFFDTIIVLHQNIAGLINKTDLLTIYIQELLDKHISVDILCITEHFIMSGQEELLLIPNYKLAACYARPNKKRGGACILVKNHLVYKELPDIMRCSIPGVIECCAIELPFQKVIVVCVYRPPKLCNLSKFYENLDIVLKMICLKKSLKVILCGDFNIDILKNNRITLDFQCFLTSYNLKLEINQPTRVSSNTCLDNFAHNCKHNCQSEVLDFGLSDHTAQILKVKVIKSCQIKYWKTLRRDISADNLMKFKSYLQSLSFSDVYATEDPNKSYDNFLEIFLLLYDLCFPYKVVTTRSDKRIKWLSRGIRICSKRQRQLLWQQRMKPTFGNKATFKNYSKRFKKIIRLTQKAQNNYLINNSSNKCKTTWQVINNSKTTSEPILQIKKGEKSITNPKEIAESFNNYFIDQISDIEEPTTSNNLINTINSNPHSIFIQPIVPQDVIRIVKSLKNKKSVGYDGISIKVIKFVSDCIAFPLAHIINVSIYSGIFPESLKTVIVKPIFKKNCKEDMSNYRPIALIPVFSKLIEKIIYERLYSFLTRYDILCDEQKGFRKNKNINMAIYDFLFKILPIVDVKTPICAIYADMSKAFDYVNHDILLRKLQAYGIRGNALNLIKSYLYGRRQCTEVSRICPKTKNELKYRSSYRVIKYGVPQGSVLGPLLFLLYINDLPRQTPNPMVLFADDSTSLIKCTNKQNYEQDINNTLGSLINWLNHNNLLINLQKTKVMHFFQRISPNDMNINHNGQAVGTVDVAKFLGILIDSQLTWKPQAESICKRLSTSAFMLHNLSKKVDLSSVLVAYHGLVISLLRFGVIFWGNCSEKESIFKAQKRCIRAMFALKVTDSCLPIFQSHKLLTFPCLYILELCIFVKTNSHLFTTLKETRNRTISIRSQYKNLLSTGLFKTALLRKSVICMAPLVYNKLPNNVKEQPLTKFKKHVTELLLHKCYYSVQEFLDDKFY